MSEFGLTEQQKAAVRDRGGELLVSAAAGSGKTSVLAERVLDRICGEGKNIDEFLIITFTNAAAAEMRYRITGEMSKRLARAPGDRHLRRQMALVCRASIMTIHSFCLSLLREGAHLAPINPDFRVADSFESDMLLTRALDDVLERCYENMEGSDFEALSDALAVGRDDRRLCGVILDTFERARNHPYPELWMEAVLNMYAEFSDASRTVWGAPLTCRAAAELGELALELGKVVSEIKKHEILIKSYLEAFERDLSLAEKIAAAMSESWDAAVEALRDSERLKLKSSRGFEDKELLQRLKKTREDFGDLLDTQREIFDCDSETLNEDLRHIFPAIRGLFAAVGELDRQYQELKDKRRVLDFGDLERYAIGLLIGSYDADTGEFTKTEFAERLSARYCEIMVDEYQDTNKTQELIISAVSQNRENVFLVGDVKQSIYGFRLSDPEIFLKKYRDFKDARDAGEHEPRRVILSRNFRSRAQVLDCVNYVFRTLMSYEFGGMDYGADEFLYAGAEYPPAENAVEFYVIDMKNGEAGEEPPEKAEIEARFVADRIKKLVDEKFEVFDGRSNSMRPVTPGDIAIIMRSPGVKAEGYRRALAALDIPARADDSGDFWGSAEIMVMTELLAVIDNPMQDVALISVLRSPLYGLTDDKLCEIRARFPNGGFYEAIQAAAAGGDSDCEGFLADMQDFRRLACEKDAYRLIWHIYNKTHAHALFGAMDAGGERQENLMMLSEYALGFENAGYKGLFMFVNYLRRLMKDGVGRAARHTAAADAVSVMSVHKSKGLEFPVVILCDLDKNFNKDDLRKPVLMHTELGVGFKYLDRERMIEYPTLPRFAIARKLEDEQYAEELRVLYVAMTRAKEKLIMTCAVRDAEKLLSRMPNENMRPLPARTLRSSASMAAWLLRALLTCTGAEDIFQYASEPCGAFLPEAETEVNIIPRYLINAETEADTIRTVADTEPMKAVREEQVRKLTEALEFEYPFGKLSDIPSKLTATQLKGRFGDVEAHEDAPAAAREHSFRRPRFLTEEGLSGAERGTALHLVMQYIDFSRCGNPGSVRAEVERIKDMELITEAQAAVVDTEKIARFFKTELGVKLRTYDYVRREFKFSILSPACDFYDTGGDTESKVMLQGVVDCYFEEQDGITTVDFKTDRVRAGFERERAEYYRGQLDGYARALAEITGKEVVKRLIYFFSTETLVEL